MNSDLVWLVVVKSRWRRKANAKGNFRLPDASIDPDLLATDIKSIGSIGAGGIEFNNFYYYGGEIPYIPTDWSIYGFGTTAYNTLLKAALQALKDNGLIMDLAIGPASGQGVPAEYDNPGLAYDLLAFNVTVDPGATYSGLVPGYGSGTLVSVTTAVILKNSSSIQETSAGTTNYCTVYTIADDSISDITGNMSIDGTIDVTFPVNGTAESYIIYATYYALSHTRACSAGVDPQNIIQNGSFTVDHFSSRGAKVTTDFLGEYVMIDGVKELFQEVGNYLWEDSAEIQSPLYWTPELAATFKEMHGYAIEPYIMLLSQNNGYGLSKVAITYPNWFETDALDKGQGYVSDWRDTMSYLLSTYHQNLTAWSNEFLGAEFSAQSGYNFPVDMLQVISAVDAPEDELLEFSGNIDSYRQFTGAANIAGKKIISNEMGAVLRMAYSQGLPKLLQLTKVAWAAGTNQIVFHGTSYSYQYPNTTWPGYTGFQYLFSEVHSRHQPAWENGYSDFFNFAARTQFILQTGKPKRDLVFWHKAPKQSEAIPTLYNETDLLEAGYGYEYISPENFNLPEAIVNNTLTTNGVAKVVDYANQGLPIIFYGGIPTSIASATGLEAAQSQLQNITALSNVHQVELGSLATAISAIDIEPLTKVNSNGTWYTYWRNDDQDDYIYIYNDGNYSEGSISFASTNHPYIFDAWTGEQTPIVRYNADADSGYTTIPFQLAASQSIIVAFLATPIEAIPGAHIRAISSSAIYEYTYGNTTGIIAKVSATKPSANITTSSGQIYSISANNVPEPFTLTNWTLIAETWGPSDDLFDVETTVKDNSTHVLPSLVPWSAISGLVNTSGVGHYSTTFNWNTNASFSAVIDFERIVQTLQVKVNGNQLPPLDCTAPRADISEFLVDRVNLVETVAATTMYNGLIPIYEQLMTSGSGPEFPLTSVDNVEAGMVGNVVVTPYRAVRIG